MAWAHENLGTHGYCLSPAVWLGAVAVLLAVCSLVTVTNFCIPSTMLAWLEGRRRREAIA
jgi:hypothetical protein